MEADAQTLTFTFDWRFAEHARFVGELNRDSFRHAVWRLVRIGIWVVIGLIALVALGSLVAAPDGEPDSSGLLPASLVLLALWLLFLTMLGRLGGWLNAWQTRRTDRNVRHPLTHVLTPEGIEVKSFTADVALRWSGLYKVHRRPPVDSLRLRSHADGQRRRPQPVK